MTPISFIRKLQRDRVVSPITPLSIRWIALIVVANFSHQGQLESFDETWLIGGTVGLLQFYEDDSHDG